MYFVFVTSAKEVVFSPVYESVCLSVCLSVNMITYELLIKSLRNVVESLDIIHQLAALF